MGGLTGWLLLLCFFCSGKANLAPSITTVVYEVCEDTPIGVVAFTIAASDPEGQPLTYWLNAPSDKFEVNPSTGAVTVKSTLDREASITLNLEVSVSDGVNPTSAKLTIILEDANDNIPQFSLSSYDKPINENAAVGSTVIRYQANDPDQGDAGNVRYSIVEITPAHGSDLFEIDEITGDLKLKGKLDYNELSSFYRITIEAKDRGGSCYSSETTFQSSNTISFFTVVDIADLDPIFLTAPYIGSIEENSPVDTSVLQVTAIDQDKGINDAIIYSIEGSTVAGLFKISSNGIISVATAIDREATGDTVTLTVKATESKLNINGQPAAVTTTVQINIGDVNDNPPKFYKCTTDCVENTQFTGEVFEHSLGAIDIGMTVKDPDRLVQTELRLDGVDKDVFYLEPSLAQSDSIVQLLVKQPKNLDFEVKTQMVVQVIAVDKKEATFQATATVTITIKDTNDNIPKFPQNTYKLNVAEHSPVGTEVTTLTAADPDTMDAGKITYSLLPDSILDYFDVESTTGKVFVKNQNLLDRELRSLYSATLQAKDTDGKPGTALLEITLTDINDKTPVINRPEYTQFVKEGGQLQEKIEATDGDEIGSVNSEIVFSIKDSPHSAKFTIDPVTGILTNNGALDREALDPAANGRIELTVIATDKGTPALSSSAAVVINVEDINDNKPVFKEKSYSFSVKEGEKGAFVGSILATDQDQTVEFNRISFSIIEGSFGSFIVRTSLVEGGYQGNITVDPDIELDYESVQKKYTLRIEAADLEQEKDSVTVEVEVLDVNDERPEFPSTPVVSVKENTTMSEPVGKFIAHDKDTNHSLVYELMSVKCRCSEEIKNCSWFTLDPSGDVRVNPAQTVDYEECDQAVVEAQVVDEYTEKGGNNSLTPGQLVINIEDINDNIPQFHYPDTVFVVVSEKASKGTSVAGVTATDLDSGTNRQISFKVDKVLFEHMDKDETSDMGMLFEAVTTQQEDNYVGIIQSTQGLQITLKGKYLVSVSATDRGGLSSTIVLEIFTIDESFHTILQFRTTKAEVEANLDEITRELTAATSTVIEIVEITEVDPPVSRNIAQCLMKAYFIFLNGTALNSVEVEKRLSAPGHFPQLNALGLLNIGNELEEENKADPVRYALLGVLAGLIIVLVVLLTSLLCTRRNYRRKLKAANAMKSASMMDADNQKGGAVVPGTNKYTMEGANPVLNLNIDTSIALDLDLNEESSDMDKASLNSLDLAENSYDMDEIGSDDDNRSKQEEPPNYSEPLSAALAQLDKKNSKNNTKIGISNPMFDTTDL
ncbi:cadherin-related family member 2 [Cyprinodon tularosa]|uniref:cadherin-related family member 2 n=1 Tax=Cyprinodon tularosa TaxID=77115 RepID=UPI0018E276C0|nr:cadherin-related family member 2 [Cyprinodon tularosa]